MPQADHARGDLRELVALGQVEVAGDVRVVVVEEVEISIIGSARRREAVRWLLAEHRSRSAARL